VLGLNYVAHFELNDVLIRDVWTRANIILAVMKIKKTLMKQDFEEGQVPNNSLLSLPDK